ncbi:MAG: Jag N-terminal domain-containing protein [Candidatus Adiutrix sp.]|nr:Jag N-terminal domain-containing protein [Candidatus Adiutrix sp.]
MAGVDFEGRDLEEAIGRAAEALGLPPEKVKFSLISMGAKGFLGLGRRRARISVDPEDPALAEVEEPALAEVEAPAREKPSSARPAGDPEPGEPRQSREKTGRVRRRESGSARETAAPEEARPLDWSHVPAPLTRPAPGEDRLSAADDPAAELAASVLGEILTRWGFTAAIGRARLGARIILNLDGGEDNALLIGVRGGTLEALQLLTGKIVARRLKESGPGFGADCRVVLDVADYRARRQEQLLETLKRAAEQARQSRQPQTLPGLNPAERRLAQMALRPFKDLALRPGSHRGILIISSVGGRPRRPRGGSRRRS